MFRRRDAQSAAIKRRSRCGSVRGCPVVSLHFSPGPAPQVGQRTVSASLRVGFLVFMVLDDAAIRRRGAVLPDISSEDHPSIAHPPRSALGFFVFRHFGFQVASASTRRVLPWLPPKRAGDGCNTIDDNQRRKLFKSDQSEGAISPRSRWLVKNRDCTH